MSIEYLGMGEFVRLVEHSTGTLDVALKEQSDGRYMALAIDTSKHRAFTVRHRRKPEPRTWCIESITFVLKEAGVSTFKVMTNA